jgi:beta-lactamase class A
MRRRIGIVLSACLIFVSSARAAGELDALAARTAAETREQFKDQAIKEDDLAISVIDLRDPAHPRTGSYRGDQPMFPASVVKLFYLAYAQRLLEDGKLADSDELQRGLRDMIVESSNDATSFILDTITDAPNGGVLPAAEMEQWSAKRNAVNRHFAALGGYDGINVNQKAYCEGPYGRERIFIGPKYENRNKLTTDATAKLLAEIAQRRFVSAMRSDAMMKLLSRDRTHKSDGPDDQAHGFIAGALPPGVKVWSKAGWTSTARHDAAYVESDDGLRAVIVIFTTGHGRDRQIVPALGKKLFDGLRGVSGTGASTQPVVK